MNKKILSIVIIFVVILAVSYFVYHYSFIVPKKGIIEKCEGYIPDWSNFIDCYGVVSITDAWDVDYLSLKDHVHGYEIARVYNFNQYLYVDGKLYVINRDIIEGQTSDGKKTQYYQKLFQNGEISIDYYDSLSDIPTYLIVNTKTGDVRAYRDKTEISETEKIYFSDIE